MSETALKSVCEQAAADLKQIAESLFRSPPDAGKAASAVLYVAGTLAGAAKAAPDHAADAGWGMYRRNSEAALADAARVKRQADAEEQLSGEDLVVCVGGSEDGVVAPVSRRMPPGAHCRIGQAVYRLGDDRKLHFVEGPQKATPALSEPENQGPAVS